MSRRPLNNAGQIFLAATTSLAVLAGAGCQTDNQALPADKAPPVAARPAGLLGPGDELEIRFFYAPDLNTTQTVRPDGQLSLQLVGEITAADLTPGQLGERIRDAYSNSLKYPECSVVVRRMNSRRVIVTGEVLRPGPLDMPAPMTLFEAIAISGGFLHTTANVKQVIVSRDDGAGHRVGYCVNMHDELDGATVTPFALSPNDIVIVPRTTIVNVNQFIQQYINNNLPNAGAVYSRQLGDGALTVDTRGIR